MLILSVKMTKTKMFLMLAVLSVLVATLSLTLGNKDSFAAASKNDSKLSTNASRIEYLNSYGLEVSKDPTVIKEITIPEEFDEVFLKYADIVKEGGFTLADIKGKRVKCYTYTVTNFSEPNTPVVANIYQYNDKVVAADISSTELGGFIKPITATLHTK